MPCFESLKKIGLRKLKANNTLNSNLFDRMIKYITYGILIAIEKAVILRLAVTPFS